MRFRKSNPPSTPESTPIPTPTPTPTHLKTPGQLGDLLDEMVAGITTVDEAVTAIYGPIRLHYQSP